MTYKSIPNLNRLDKNILEPHTKEIIAFCCVRNENLRLPFFLRYHRDLGINRFIVVDNGSTDGTLDFLLAQKDVHVFYTEDSYAESKCGIDWINSLLDRFGTGHWTVTLDADELLIYPMCENINLHQLVKYLDYKKAQGLVTFMLDMYSDSAIKETNYISGSPFFESCQYFDSTTYYERGNDFIPIRGGPRHRLFWKNKNRMKPSPVLKKIPLVKWRSDLHFEASTHIISNVRFSCLTGILLHFKLFSDFYSQAEKEVQRKEHWDDAAQYESYWDVLRKNPDLTAMYDGSLCYKDSLQLVDLGMIQMPKDFEEFVTFETQK